MNAQFVQDFIRREALPDSYAADCASWFAPLADTLAQRVAVPGAAGKGLVLGISGAQGTGKSTLARFLAGALQSRGLHTVNLSIDDFYLSRAEREALARDRHPLLRSRGVPGTHDTALLLTKLDELQGSTSADAVALPAFDKATDDCLPRADWPRVRGAPALVLLEGWFIGVRPQQPVDLEAPVNALEREQDPDGSWRRYVNDCLAGAYQAAFDRLDSLLMLQAPSFHQVSAWRGLQEEKLRAARGGNGGGIMNAAELATFIQHFERLTRHCLRTLPDRADLVLHLGGDHRVSGQTGSL